MNLESLKNSWLVPAIVVLVLAFVAVKKFNFSFTDFVADKVIQKLDANYSPYGPTQPVKNTH